mgnify:CR=1 FL=1
MLGGEIWVLVSACGPGSETSGEESDDVRMNQERNAVRMKKSSECVEERDRGRSHVVLLGDLNVRIGNEEVLGVIGKFGEPGRNLNGERLLQMHSEMETVIGNT